MASGQITIADPLGTIPPVVMEAIANDGYYSRSRVQAKTFAEWTAAGTGIIDGPTGGTRYLFNIICSLPKADALRFEALCELQNDRLDADISPAYLLLTDEVEELPPVTSQPRPLIGSVTTSYGKTYGFGTFRVHVDLPDNHKKFDGKGSDGVYKLVQLTATEVELP